MRNHTCLSDHHQRSHNDTITIGPEGIEQQPVGKIVRPSCGEDQRATFSQLTQPKPKPICDRSGKPDNLSENTRVEQTHDGSGQPDERDSSSAHTVKDQFAPEENRDLALFNTDNECNRAINEENIDFNVPGLPLSAVKQSHDANVQHLIQKIENHPHRHALQSDLRQRQQFNPFSKESQDMIREAGNIDLCELLNVWDVGIVYCTSSHGHRYGKKPGDHEYFIANSLKKKCKKRHFLGIHDRFIRDEKFRKNMIDMCRNEEICRDGQIGERRPHAPHHSRGKSSLSKQLVDSFEHSWFRYDASKAST